MYMYIDIRLCVTYISTDALARIDYITQMATLLGKRMIVNRWILGYLTNSCSGKRPKSKPYLNTRKRHGFGTVSNTWKGYIRTFGAWFLRSSNKPWNLNVACFWCQKHQFFQPFNRWSVASFLAQIPAA